ncbi:energy-coupling factor transport system ATP-binding protein [Sporobacter termitidis DSM 10068]|uniref:Energy-coupling factor transport system ATP-binding protein n=1 Tax=Sporobacter termitidis DSM 10068 TaxID=1123282 RepID=A0A1M5W5I3_9FIRM|nr:ABC transporter ATP-binding protein [Sporobacter termitidis]SHH82454.1 energy-coupling factor transport system ATP-binding protein [Sporobacter termitidis DSM 10068]
MIHLENLSFAYGEDEMDGELTNVTMDIRKGECVVLCGPSGCGKTTLLRLISGLIPSVYDGVMHGSALVDGKPPAAFSPEEKAQKIGMVFQDPRSQFFMSKVRDELAFSGENLGLPPNKIIERIDELAGLLRITDLLDTDLNKMSSGQKQKVAIASACLLSPLLLLLDEPSANLDAASKEELIRILLAIKQAGTTIIVSEHRLHEFLPVADRYLCIGQGELVKEWSREQFAALSCAEAMEYGLRHPDAARRGQDRKNTATPGRLPYYGRGITYCYRESSRGIKHVDFALCPGTVTALTGGNGTGKTTLCKILCGLLSPQKGKVLSGDKTLSRAARREGSYFVMQDADYQLYTDSVGNELVLGRAMTDVLRKRAYEALDLFGLMHLKDRHPASLSGGEKQRVTLAAAFCTDADLIVLDEPTSGLDAINVQRLVRYVQILAREGKTVIVITHDQLLIDLVCDDVILLGNIKES